MSSKFTRRQVLKAGTALAATAVFAEPIRAAAPAERHRVFARFYRLSPGLIGRFYAGRSTAYDKLRILCGRPPAPIRSAMRAMSDSKA